MRVNSYNNLPQQRSGVRNDFYKDVKLKPRLSPEDWKEVWQETYGKKSGETSEVVSKPLSFLQQLGNWVKKQMSERKYKEPVDLDVDPF